MGCFLVSDDTIAQYEQRTLVQADSCGEGLARRDDVVRAVEPCCLAEEVVQVFWCCAGVGQDDWLHPVFHHREFRAGGKEEDLCHAIGDKLLQLGVAVVFGRIVGVAVCFLRIVGMLVVFERISVVLMLFGRIVGVAVVFGSIAVMLML